MAPERADLCCDSGCWPVVGRWRQLCGMVTPNWPMTPLHKFRILRRKNPSASSSSSSGRMETLPDENEKKKEKRRALKSPTPQSSQDDVSVCNFFCNISPFTGRVSSFVPKTFLQQRRRRMWSWTGRRRPFPVCCHYDDGDDCHMTSRYIYFIRLLRDI